MFLKTKIKSHGHEVTDFLDKEIPKLGYTSLAVINLDSALNKYRNYYTLVILKCTLKKKIINTLKKGY